MNRKITYREFKSNAQELDFDSKPDLDEAKARELRDKGIEIAVDHANAVEPRWVDKAYEFFVNKFLLNHNGTFLGEDFRSYCALMDFPLPPHNRAFGGVFIKAVKAGIIKSMGTKNTRSKKSHRTPATLWIQVKPSERK